MEKANQLKAKYFFDRAEKVANLEEKLILLNNAYSCFDGLKPAYSVVFLPKDEFKALINACANDSDCDLKCSPAHYDLETLCNKLQLEIKPLLQSF